MIPYQYNFRSIWVRRVTAIITVLGVALVTAVLAAALMLAAGVRKSVATGGQDDVAIIMRAGATGELESGVDESAVGLVLSQPGLAQENGKPIGGGEILVVVALDKIGAMMPAAAHSRAARHPTNPSAQDTLRPFSGT